MGTRSTVKFYDYGEVVLSLYQQYDGYPEGVGMQIVDTLEKYTLVNGLSYGEEGHFANGVSELALYYIQDHKKGPGNIYATSASDEQEYNYEVWRDEENGTYRIRMKPENHVGFEGSLQEFKQMIYNRASS